MDDLRTRLMNFIPYKPHETSDHGTVWFPDLALMVERRLMAGSTLTVSGLDFSAIGRLVLQRLSEPRVRGSGGLRLSKAGSCIRRLAYDVHHWAKNGHVEDASSIMTFSTGDMTELMITAALADAFEKVPFSVNADDEQGLTRPVRMFQLKNWGPDQRTVTMPVEISDNRCAMVPGHPDGQMILPIFIGNAKYPTPAQVVLEVKSMSDYGFKLFRQHGGYAPNDSYNGQIQAYMAATEADFTYVIAFGKNVLAKDWVNDDESADMPGDNWRRAPAILGSVVESDFEHARSIKMKFQRVLTSSSPNDIPRPHQPDRNGRLRFPCDWCPYWGHCWPNAKERAVTTKWMQRANKVHLYSGWYSDTDTGE